MPRATGFTLIEVLVSLLLIGAMLMAFQATLLGTPLAAGAKHQDLALRIAQHEVEALRAAGYAALPASGSFASSQLALLPSGSGERAVTTYNDKTKQVVVTVSWQERGASRSVSLTTLMTEIGGLL